MSPFHRRVPLFLTLILSAAALFSATLSAQNVAGHLDTTFGAGGVVTTDILALDNQAYAVAIQPDGKICVAGRVGGLDAAFGVVRYLKDGQLDTSFGDGGKVLTGINSYSTPTTLALTADGKLLVGGYYLQIADELCFGLVRLNADGQLDKSFGIDGKVREKGTGKPIFEGIDALSWMRAMAVQPDGKIVIAGVYEIFGTGDRRLFALRLNADGSVDTSFGAGGKVLSAVACDNTMADLLIEADGKIVIAASGGTPFGACLLMRLNANGSPDATFGTSGMVTTTFGGSNARYAALATTTDGKYLLAGSVTRGPAASADDFALARFNKNGSPDLSFGVGGLVVKDIGVNDRVRDLLTQPDGKILLAGYSGIQATNATLPSEARLALLRFNADGSEDSSFNAQEVNAETSRLTLVNALAMQADGRIVVAGSSGSNVLGYDFLVARYESGFVAPDFALAAEPATVTGARGSKVRVKILVNRVGGFTGELSLAQPELPLKVVITAIEPALDGAGFILKIKGKAKPGTYPLVFEASDTAGRKRLATVTLIIN